MEDRRVPVLYVDLDGTVRKGKDELGRFVNGPEDVELFEGMPAILAAYKAAGWRIIGVSNQGGIALGIVTMERAAAAMERTHELSGGAFDTIAMCRHHPDAKDPELAVCWCRKPRAGLAITAVEGLQNRGEMYPPHLALFVGDRPEDEACAASLNVRFMWAKDWRALEKHPAEWD